jgi:hypothetical protein
MIIIKLQGGLGNQMFQFAFAHSLNKKLGVRVKFDISWFKKQKVFTNVLLGEVFNIDLEIAQKHEIQKIIGLRKYLLINKILCLIKFPMRTYVKEDKNKNQIDFTNKLDNKYFDGYWQNWNYFNDYINQLNKVFSFKAQISKDCIKWAETIKGSNSVSIHLRRGDYFNEKKNVDIFHELKTDYFNKAIKLIEKNHNDLKYFVFSDYINYAKNLFIRKKNFYYIDINKGSKSFRDMQLMSLSKHIIISNSTFSWWAAWLNHEKKNTIIAPKFWFKDEAIAHQYYLPKWKII